MRALVITLVCTPALAIAQPAVTVAVDVHVSADSELLGPPGTIAPLAPPAPPAPPALPARWFSVGGTLAVATHDELSNDASDPGFGARLEVDLIASDSWRAASRSGGARTSDSSMATTTTTAQR